MPTPYNSKRSRSATRSQVRLSIIIEDGDNPPPPPQSAPAKPPTTHHHPWSRLGRSWAPPRHSYEKSPPPYSVWNTTGPRGERLADARNNKYIARRGGWRRLIAIALVLIAIIVGLIVGLVVGLRKHHNRSANSPSPSSSSSSPPNASMPFPAGSYSFTTFLDTVSTNCTSIPSTWDCYPYRTYATSPTASLATFNWIIMVSTTGSSTNYTISSTDNTFAIDFSNASLTLEDENTSNERYTFQVPINKVVVPSTAITSDNQMATCQFNSTQFSANLYTKMSKTYPPAQSVTSTASTPSATTTGGFPPWPYAVEVMQTIGGGDNVPACFEVQNGNLGDRITNGLTALASGNECGCTYKNYDP